MRLVLEVTSLNKESKQLTRGRPYVNSSGSEEDEAKEGRSDDVDGCQGRNVPRGGANEHGDDGKIPQNAQDSMCFSLVSRSFLHFLGAICPVSHALRGYSTSRSTTF